MEFSLAAVFSLKLDYPGSFVLQGSSALPFTPVSSVLKSSLIFFLGGYLDVSVMIIQTWAWIYLHWTLATPPLSVLFSLCNKHKDLGHLVGTSLPSDIWASWTSSPNSHLLQDNVGLWTLAQLTNNTPTGFVSQQGDVLEICCVVTDQAPSVHLGMQHECSLVWPCTPHSTWCILMLAYYSCHVGLHQGDVEMLGSARLHGRTSRLVAIPPPFTLALGSSWWHW